MQEQRSLFGEEEESEQKYVNDRTTHHYSVDTTEVADDPLVLLNDMMSGVFVGSTASFNRGRKILRPHDAEITDSWAFCVPRYFNDALDIKLTEVKIDKVPHLVWTQGTSFAFQRDDIIYDVPRKVRSEEHTSELQSR